MEWQTCGTQNPVPATACEFDSHLGHGFAAITQTCNPLEKVLSRERGLQLKQAPSLLRPEDRRCIELFHIKQRSCEEIAAELAIPRRTVETRLDRGRKQLGAALKKLQNP